MQLRPVVVALLVVVAVGTAPTAADTTGQSAARDAAIDTYLAPDCEFPLEVEDATSETVTVEEEPESVVVTTPSLAQQMWEIGSKEKVVGMPVNSFTDYLDGSEDRTDVVDDLGRVNIETVVDLDPGIVLASNLTGQDTVNQLRNAGLTVFHYPVIHDLESIAQSVNRTGQLVGDCDSAATVADDMTDRTERVEQATADVEELRVFYDLSSTFTAGVDTTENDVLTSAGTENIAASAGLEGYRQISAETLVEQDPEVVVVPMDLSPTDGILTTDVDREQLSDIEGYEETTALQNDRLIGIDTKLISQAGPRMIDLLEALAGQIHGNLDDGDGSVVGLDHSDSVLVDGAFELTVETTASAETVVEFETSGFNVSPRSDRAVEITDDRVRFLDGGAGDSTYTIELNVTSGAEGEVGEITAWVNAEAEEDADDVQSSSFELVTDPSPTAEAGPDQTVSESTDVELDATGSSDPDGDTLSYTWTQTGGPAVSLTDAETATPEFTAPTVDTETDLVFEVTVDDGSATDTDTTTVTVQPADDEGPPPVTGEDPPTDPDGDGTYEDLDGDGELTLSDVRLYYQELYQNRESEYVQENTEYYDLTGDGEITLADVKALFEERTG